MRQAIFNEQGSLRDNPLFLPEPARGGVQRGSRARALPASGAATPGTSRFKVEDGSAGNSPRGSQPGAPVKSDPGSSSGLFTDPVPQLQEDLHRPIGGPQQEQQQEREEQQQPPAAAAASAGGSGERRQSSAAALLSTLEGLREAAAAIRLGSPTVAPAEQRKAAGPWTGVQDVHISLEAAGGPDPPLPQPAVSLDPPLPEPVLPPADHAPFPAGACLPGRGVSPASGPTAPCH